MAPFPLLLFVSLVAVAHYVLSFYATKTSSRQVRLYDWEQIRGPLCAYLFGVLLFFLSPAIVSGIASLMTGLFPDGQLPSVDPLSPALATLLFHTTQSIVFLSVLGTAVLYLAAIVLMVSSAKKPLLFLSAFLFFLVLGAFLLGAGLLRLAEIYQVSPM